MRILITGIRGMVGLDMAMQAKLLGHEVVGLISDRHDDRTFDLDIKLIKANICEPFFIDQNIDAIIHCAAYTDVSKAESEKEKCYKLNVDGTRNVRNLAREKGAKLVYISTPFVFDGYTGNYSEEDCPLPLNFYANTKLIGEEISKDHDNHLIIRASPIGMRAEGMLQNFVQWFIYKAKNNESFNLFTDVRLNLLHTKTLASLILDAIEKDEKGILHLASRDIVNKAEIWDYIVTFYPKYSGKVTRMSVDGTEAGKIAHRPKEMWLNVDRALASGYKLPSWKDELNHFDLV